MPRSTRKFNYAGFRARLARRRKLMRRGKFKTHRSKVPKGLSLGRPTQTGPFPKNLYTKLKYFDLEDISITAGAMSGFTYKLNSLYDPYSSGAGNQPRFFDTLCGADGGAAPYNKYRVFGAKVKVSFLNDNTSGSTQGMVAIHWRNSANTAPASIYDLVEGPNSKTKLVGVTNAQQGITTISKYIPIGPILGVKDLRDDEDSGAQYNADPASTVLLDCLYQPYGTAVTTTIQCQVAITYYCQFYEQNMPAQS